MSYCRWSSDDWDSDLYVYESSEGFMVHVARLRAEPAFFDALPPPVELRGADTDWLAWTERSQQVTALLDGFDLVPIDLPHAGESACFDSGSEAAGAVEWLAAVGFHVPDGVAEDLHADDAEQVAS